MRIRPGRTGADVTRSPNRRRPVLLTVSGLTVELSRSEAIRLADALHDTVEEIE